MPSRRSQEMLGLLRSHKQIASAMNREWIMKLDPPADLVARLRMNGTLGVSIRELGMPAVLIEPRQLPLEDGVILHLHGGAYVSGGIMQCRALISPICAAAGVRALTFSYRLAPRHPYPAQLEDALKAYFYLRKAGYAPEKIALVGESAGGNLALELALRLKQMGEGMPAAIALLSPWADLAQTGESYRTLRAVDATLDAEELMQSAIAFSGGGERLTAPDISPLYAEFTGFPPVQIHCGTHEILLSDSEGLDRALRRDGVTVQLIRWAGMCHVFQAFGFEESKVSNRQIGAFLRRWLTGAGQAEREETPEKVSR